MADCHIDNRDDLFGKLGVSVFEQDAISNDQLILLAYRQWGQDCLKYLLGDFSFAVRDKSTGQVFCGRDPVGIKPFYYSFSNEYFFCANNINDVIAQPAVTTQLDEPFVAGYLNDKFFAHSERTIFQDVKKLPAGHMLFIGGGETKLERYWFPENVPPIRYRNDNDYAEALIGLYKEVIQDYVRNPDPIGVELSGGLDSSSIAVLAAEALQQHNRPTPLVYCWEPQPDTNSDQQPYIYSLIQAVCNQAELVPQYSFPTGADVELYFKWNLMHNPATGVLFHQLPIQRKAQKQGVRTILSGWGGDQCVTSNGPAYYAELVHKHQWRKLFHEASSEVSPMRFIAKQALKQWMPNIIWRQGILLRNRNRAHQKKHLNKDFARRVMALDRQAYTRHETVQQAQIARLLDPSLTERLEGSAASGAEHGIVYRYPMLDRRLLEFTLGLPADQFRRGKTRRWIARKAFENVLPEEVCSYTDKNDTVRTDAIQSVLGDVRENLVQSLQDTFSSKMSDYVDVDSLRTQLESPEFKKSPKLGKIRNALHLLNSV